LVNVVSLRKRPNSLYLQNKLSPYPDALQHLSPLPPVLSLPDPATPAPTCSLLNSGLTRRTSLRPTAAAVLQPFHTSVVCVLVLSVLPCCRQRDFVGCWRLSRRFGVCGLALLLRLLLKSGMWLRSTKRHHDTHRESPMSWARLKV
jgi:hypothetical protein